MEGGESMVYQTASMKLKMLSVILTGECGDILLCREMAEGEEKPFPADCKVLWIVKERKMVRFLMKPENALPWIECFPYGEHLCIVMPYEKRRPLFKFWKAVQEKGPDKETVCREIITLCMTCRFPHPVLELLLKQRQLNMKEDGGLYFTWEADLALLDLNVRERDCVQACAVLLTEFLGADGESFRICELMGKKLSRGQYQTFLDLYLDWKQPPCTRQKWSFSDRLKVRTFYIFSAAAAILFFLMVIAAVSCLAFGDIPLLRLFTEPFRRIGTEVLGAVFLKSFI